MKNVLTIGVPSGYGVDIPLEKLNFNVLGTDIEVINNIKQLGFDMLLPFPKTPAEFEIATENYTYERVNPANFGTLLIPQNLGTTTISFSDFIPANNYEFNLPFALKGLRFIQFLEFLKKKAVPLNMWMSFSNTIYEGFITKIDYKHTHTGDIDYSVTFEIQPRIVQPEVKDIRSLTGDVQESLGF